MTEDLLPRPLGGHRAASLYRCGEAMRHLLLLIFLLPLSTPAHAVAVIYCGMKDNVRTCFAALHYSQIYTASSQAGGTCTKYGFSDCTVEQVFDHGCVATTVGRYPYKEWLGGPDLEKVTKAATDHCNATVNDPQLCASTFAVCETSDHPTDMPPNSPSVLVDSILIAHPPSPQSSQSSTPQVSHPTISAPSPPSYSPSSSLPSSPYGFFNFGAIGTGISYGIGVVIVLLIYAARGPILNFVIHGNLPYQLPVYAEDIQLLFKRTQRVNWYGRVVFGLDTKMGMTEKQIALVRRHWLGRVVVFDSLRRQKQTQLAQMHLRLAASVKTPGKAHSATDQLLSALKFFFLVFFYLFRALLSFISSLFFLRVTIAKLVRGTRLESKSLPLLLEAKEAIEESATQLKQYLITAETFDGSDELHNA